jgi:hypothetical protein
MRHLPSSLATPPQRTSPTRGFQVVSCKDRPRLEAFFLAFNFNQRREFFGSCISDESIRDYCRAIRWSETTIIARSCGARLEAVAIVTATASRGIAELSIACAAECDRQSAVADLLDLSLTAASLNYTQLIVDYERAMPELLALLHRSPFAVFDVDIVRVDVPCYSAKIVAC